MTQNAPPPPGSRKRNKKGALSPATSLPIQANEDQVLALFDAAPLGMILSDSSRVILAVNHEVEMMFGYQRQELIGNTIEILLPEEVQQIHIQHQEKFFHEVSQEAQWRSMGRGRDLSARRKSGEIFPVEIGLSPIITPLGLRAMTSIVDISVRKSIENALFRAEQHYSDQLTRLQEINIELSQSDTFDDLCQQAVEKGRAFLSVDRIGLWFLDPQDPSFMVGSFGVDEKGNSRDERHRRISIHEVPVFQFLTGSKGRLYKQENELLYDDQRQVVGKGSSAVAGVWGDGERITGYLSVDNLISNRTISEEQEKLLMLYAQIIGHLSERKRSEEERVRLLQAVQRRANQLTLLNQIALETASSLDLSNLLRSLYEQLKIIFPVDVFYVVLYDDNKKTLSYPVYAEGDVYEYHAINDRVQMPIQLETSFTSQIILDGKTLYIPDTEQIDQPLLAKANWGNAVQTYLGVPLKDAGQVTGVLSIQSYQPQAYSEDMINLLETIAAQVAMVIQNARLFSQVQTLAILDPLTGLYNRRYFFDQAQKEFERAIRYQRSFSIFMIDIDFVKQVNDHYGHLVGDEVIKTVAEWCRRNLRDVDLLGRYGGDELVALLPETPDTTRLPHDEELGNQEVILNIAQRLRQIIGFNPIPTSAGPLQVTLSIGVAWITVECNNLEAVLERSDQALYQAKQSGRNRVVIWQKKPSEES